MDLADVVARGGIAERIDGDLHAPAANQAVVPAVVVVELKAGDQRRALAQHGQRAAFDLGLDAAAAERAGLAAIVEHEHRRAGLLRRAAARFHEPAQRYPPIAVQRCDKLLQ